MPEDRDLDSYMFTALDDIDRILAEQGYLVSERPLQAALAFVRIHVIEWTEDNHQTVVKPGAVSELVNTRMFRTVYLRVENWYRERYGENSDERPDRMVRGFVLAYSTPYAVRIPTTAVRQGTPGKTIWVTWLGTVSPDDEIQSWLVAPPNLDRMPADELGRVRSSIRRVASALRFLNLGLLGTSNKDPSLPELKRAVITDLGDAASSVLHPEERQNVQRPYWNLQMAAEGTLKAFLQERTGEFWRTHDLHALYRKAKEHGLTLPDGLLNKIPGEKEMMDRRYGRGSPSGVIEFFSAYLAVLELACAVGRAMKQRFSDSFSIEIRKAPWLDDDPPVPVG